MTGPEHYREAERLIADVHHMLGVATDNTFGEALDASVPMLSRAQVHATLALAAATARATLIQAAS